jgi:hypothetical protein
MTRQNVVKEYMIACTNSITEELILSAWRRSGIRPLNPGVFTEEDFASSYASSTSPPFPISFPGPTDNLDSPQAEDPDRPSGEEYERTSHSENLGVESRALIEASALNVNMGPSCGSLSMLNQIVPDQEVAYNFPLSAPSPQPMTLSPQSNETSHVLREDQRRDSLTPPQSAWNPGGRPHPYAILADIA